MLQGVAVTSVGRGRPRESPWGPYWGDSFRHCASPSRGQVPGQFLVGLGLWTGPSPKPPFPPCFAESQGRAGRAHWAPTKFTEEPEEAWGALAEGGVGSRASATIVALTATGGSCHGGREMLQ